MDRDRADKDSVLESLRADLGRQTIPIFLPISAERNLTGVVDLVTMKAYTYSMGGNGKGKEGPIPAELAEEAKAAHEALVDLFFQAEDGIRDDLVTGVQTCALPIFGLALAA